MTTKVRLFSSRQQSHDQKNQPPCSGDQAEVIDGSYPDEDRDRGQDDADLEAGDTQREPLVLVEFVMTFGLEVLGLFLHFFLLTVVALDLFLKVLERCGMRF